MFQPCHGRLTGQILAALSPEEATLLERIKAISVTAAADIIEATSEILRVVAARRILQEKEE